MKICLTKIQGQPKKFYHGDGVISNLMQLLYGVIKKLRLQWDWVNWIILDIFWSAIFQMNAITQLCCSVAHHLLWFCCYQGIYYVPRPEFFEFCKRKLFFQLWRPFWGFVLKLHRKYSKVSRVSRVSRVSIVLKYTKI